MRRAARRTTSSGVPGAYISDLLLQTFGLAIVLVPVALITWGVRMVRTHHLGFFGLRLSLLLLALLMMSVACVGLGDVGGAATHAGPGGLVGLALVGRFRELVLTHSSGGSLALIEPACAALAFIAMAPALGMNRTDLPLIFRILRAPFLWRRVAGAGRRRPVARQAAVARRGGRPAGAADRLCRDPGRDRRQPVRSGAFRDRRFEQIPEEGAPLPARDSLMVDAPYAPIERPADEIPRDAAGPRSPSPAPTAAEFGAGAHPVRPPGRHCASSRSWAACGRAAPAAERVEPRRAAAGSTAASGDAQPEAEEADDDNPFTPDALLPIRRRRPPATGVTIVPRKSAAAQGKRAAKAGQRELDLATGEYQLPPLDILSLPSRVSTETKIDEEALEQNARLLETVLDDFGVKGQIVKVRPGPVVTLYELEPAPGTKSSRVIGLADDIARSMSAVSARVATVPGRNVIGIELPNARRETVFLRELLSTRHYEDNRLGLPLALGKDIGGDPVIADLARMPHLLIAGTTGSGKSVAVNTMILSLLYRLPPDQLPLHHDRSQDAGAQRLRGHPASADARRHRAAQGDRGAEVGGARDGGALPRHERAGRAQHRRLQRAARRGAQRKGEALTRKVQTGIDPETRRPIFEEEEIDLTPLPFIVVIIDEMADLMLVAGKEIEAAVQRLAQMARAAGIHVIMATQRPSVDVITGTIKANFPTRICFQVTSKIDSRTILGEQGGEQLLGQGDMLYMAGGGKIARVHGPFVSDAEVEEVVRHLRAQGEPAYIESVTDDPDAEEGGLGLPGEAARTARATSSTTRRSRWWRASASAATSFIQRYLQIGYNRAARIIERMEREGVVSPANHVGKREVLARDIDDRER